MSKLKLVSNGVCSVDLRLRRRQKGPRPKKGVKKFDNGFNCITGTHTYTPCPRKKQATFIFNITSPSVEIFLQFLMHLVQD